MNQFQIFNDFNKLLRKWNLMCVKMLCKDNFYIIYLLKKNLSMAMFSEGTYVFQDFVFLREYYNN